MTLSRKDFEDLASRLAGLATPPETTTAILAFCESQNPCFDRARFLAWTQGEHRRGAHPEV